MSCPWGNIEKSEPVKFEDIISEEIYKNLQNKKEKYSGEIDEVKSTAEVYDASVERNTDDFGDFESDVEEEEIVDMEDENDWGIFDPLNKEFSHLPQCAFKKSKSVETAEYATISGGKNTSCKLSSKVFNSLKPSSYNEEFRRYKVHRDKSKRSPSKALSIDHRAWCLIREMIKDQILERVIGILSFDDEAVFLRAVRPYVKTDHLKSWIKTYPTQCMIKVYKINLKLGKAHVTACRQKAEKEVVIYTKLKEAGVHCPDVITQREHVLVTSYPGPISKDYCKIIYYYDYIYREAVSENKHQKWTGI